MDTLLESPPMLPWILCYLGKYAQAKGIYRSEGIRCIVAHIKDTNDLLLTCANLHPDLHAELLVALTDQQLPKIFPNADSLHKILLKIDKEAACFLIDRLSTPRPFDIIRQHLPTIIHNAKSFHQAFRSCIDTQLIHLVLSNLDLDPHCTAEYKRIFAVLNQRMAANKPVPTKDLTNPTSTESEQSKQHPKNQPVPSSRQLQQNVIDLLTKSSQQPSTDSLLNENQRQFRTYIQNHIKQMYQTPKHLKAAQHHLYYLLTYQPWNNMVNRWIRRISKNRSFSQARKYVARAELSLIPVTRFFEIKLLFLNGKQKRVLDCLRSQLTNISDVNIGMTWLGAELFGKMRRYDLAYHSCIKFLENGLHNYIYQRTIWNSYLKGEYTRVLRFAYKPNDAFTPSQTPLQHQQNVVPELPPSICEILDHIEKEEYKKAEEMTKQRGSLLIKTTRCIIQAHQKVQFADRTLENLSHYKISLPKKLSKPYPLLKLSLEEALFHENRKIRSNAKKQVSCRLLYTLGFLHGILDEQHLAKKYLSIAIEKDRQNIASMSSQDKTRRKAALLHLGKACCYIGWIARDTDFTLSKKEFTQAVEHYNEAADIRVDNKFFEVLIPTTVFDENYTGNLSRGVGFSTQHDKHHYWWFQTAKEGTNKKFDISKTQQLPFFAQETRSRKQENGDDFRTVVRSKQTTGMS